ncbi:hypothetical protein [Halomonas ventosae]|uniref:Uncharacterized protein n=1 Tax=Halomonas ventosae TaxID=229007 RepID=A0A2T0VM75_9GAMM|nr:hypothetical protein [Halomonas ventosae]PRY71388.1 hypothetical protein BCL64_108149 [Halomonas ventosae]
MRTTIVSCIAVIALGLAFGAAAAEQTLKPLHAYRLGNEDQPAVLYYTERGDGYEIVTTWVDEQKVQMRHIGHLEPGQRYTLSLGGLSPPVQFTVHGDANQVIMGVAERPAYARRCSGPEAAYPTPLQRLVLCLRVRGGADRPLSADIGLTRRGHP